MQSGAPWWASQRLRLTVLLACLGALVFYLLATRIGALGLGADASQPPATGEWAAGCPARGAPPVTKVSVGYLAELRAGLRGVVRGGHRRLYRFGTIASDNAWSDNFPQPGAILLPQIALVPGAYEMRWWMPNRDDVVADVFVFHQGGQARDFFERASSARCRRESAQLPASSPPNARDLVWRNPDVVVQEDVYMLRGNRVYRISDVRLQQGTRQSAREQRTAFAIVNGLACALPDAGCEAAVRQHHLALLSLAQEWPAATSRSSRLAASSTSPRLAGTSRSAWLAGASRSARRRRQYR